MNIQILNSFKGDDKRDIDTSSPEGRKSAASLISDLLRTGSALFLEKEVNGKTYTYRVTGYDEATDKVKLSLAPDDKAPEGAEVKHRSSRKGMRYNTGSRRREARDAMVGSDSGQLVSVAPVSGGSGAEAVEEPLAEAPQLSWEGLRYGIARLCEERGWHHGCPMPTAWLPSAPLVLAKGSPLSDKAGHGVPMSFMAGERSFTCSSADINEDPERLINRWLPAPVEVQVYRDSKGTFKLRMPQSAVRLRMYLDTFICRAGAVNSDTEFVAMRSLFEKITEQQRDSYVLNNAFLEKSQRSGVTYVLRKGLPTIALKIERVGENEERRRFLAALCLHPMAYYANTFAGSQPPTDEVIAHLMMIRADEHRFWKKAGQHPIEDPRAGI